MSTYYEILNVETTSSPDEIKRAFRRRAKELHPDIDPHHDLRPEAMQGLLAAYETLMDPIRREDYDRRNFIFTPDVKFNYRDFLKSRSDDASLQARLVFFDLLHHHESDAVNLYDELAQADHFDLGEFLDREDYMDCAFLLAEEYERQHRYSDAFELLLDIVDMESEQPYFRHFFLEVTDRLRTLVCFKMPERMPAEDVIEYLDRVIMLDFPPKDRAFYLKKAAELYLEVGKVATASSYLQRGLQYDEKLAGTKKLKERLAMLQAV